MKRSRLFPYRSRALRAGYAAAGLIAATTVVLAGCSSDSGSGSSSGMPTVVTSTNVWGAVASAVAGDKAQVTSLYTNADGDPHEFEPSAADTADVADADVIVMNGGHYDAYLEQAAGDNSSATVVNAYSLMTGAEHDHSAEESQTGEDHAESDGHSHDSTTNEHVFYNLSVVADVADHVAEALAEKSPADADYFHANAEKFDGEIDSLRAQLATIKQQHNGVKVAQTEPLAGYLLTEAGLHDVAPAGFTQAVEEGQSPSAADRAAMEDLLTTRTVKAFIYNTQAVDPVTEALLNTAASANVAVVKFSETLPDGVSDYVQWQRTQIQQLSAALDKA